MATLTFDVIVLGGGPAGVATALEAAERGRSVVLLERESNTGGMAGSFEVDGMQVDFGSHRLHPVTPPAVMQRLSGLLGEDLQVRRRHGRLRLGDRWVEFPLRPADMACSMPPAWLARVARDAALSPLRRRRTRTQPGDETSLGLAGDAAGPSVSDSYAATLRASLGPTVYDSLYAPYALKLWGLPGEAIDAEQARVRVSADTVPKVAARVLRSAVRNAIRQRPRLTTARSTDELAAESASESDARPAPQGATFNYPRRGFGQITEGLDAAARAAGVQIMTGVTVASVTPHCETAPSSPPGSMVQVKSAQGQVWQAPRVFSTLPIPLLARLSDPSPPPQVIDDAKALRFRAMVLLYVTHRFDEGHTADRPTDVQTHQEGQGGDGPQHGRNTQTEAAVRWSSYDAHYLPGEGSPITRLSEPANYRDNPDDPQDRSVICAEIPCTVSDEVWTASNETLLTILRRAVADFDLPALNISGVEVRRLPSVYPIYAHGFADRLARLEHWADGIPGVTTLGRSGLFAHDNTHHAFVMARVAAEALRPDGSFDDAQWRQARESFRDHVVED